ncbi:MAG: uroporphyrinogen-III C-methyltransferase [Candidatus Omnitrophica bacterium]|nr:uroporphyrinogen-III C-methyltransferase [Candidatus Omnitrophota bacterium]
MICKGIVYLVGAGPGDPGLLTLRGAELLRRADTVVYDGLVNRDLLRMAPSAAELIYGGKHGPPLPLSQEALNALLINKARAGKCVVRLKGGDPYVLGRGGEEAEELAKAGVPFEVVPGISSAEAVANYAGIPLTHRAYASSYTVVTGHGDPTTNEGRMDWSRLAQTPGTLVVLMGVKQIRSIARTLIDHGRPPSMPVAMIRRGTTGRQQTIEGNLATIADLVDQTHFLPPAVTVIGEVVRLREKLDWFEKLPLFGQTIVVTRPIEQAEPFSHRLMELGADVLEIPMIKTAAPRDNHALAEALVGLNSYDWIIFTSPNGVTWFFSIFFKKFQDMRDIGGVRIAAIGPATAAKLRELHLQVDIMPEEALATKVASAMVAYESIVNLRILLLRAEVATPELPKMLEELGAIVDDIPCYRTVPETSASPEAIAKLTESGADWISFTSGSTVQQFDEHFHLPQLIKKFPQIKLASIGPETSKALDALSLKPTIEANPHTIEGMVDTLVQTSKSVALRKT